jgi:hypothetical protein
MFPRYNRQVDCCPESNIHCCNVVSRTSVSALSTSKFVSSRSISLRDITARWTCLRSVSRIDKDHRNASDLGLVIHEHSKQPEIPSMQAATLRLSNRNSISNALKIFKSNRSKSVFGFCNYFLGNAMVHVFREPRHPARKLLEMAFSGFCAFTLKSGFERIKFVSGLCSLRTGMDLAVGIDSQILDPKIDTKNIYGIIKRCFGDFDHHTQIEYIFDKDQISLASNPVHPSFLIITKSNRYNLPTLECSQRDFFKSFPRKDALIIDNSSIKPKLRLDRLISLVGFADLGNRPDGKLCGESKLLPDGIIDSLVDLKFVSTMQSENSLSYVITSFVKPLHCFREHLVLLLRGIKLNHQGLKHYIEHITQYINSFGCISTAGYAPLRPEDRSFRYPCIPEAL